MVPLGIQTSGDRPCLPLDSRGARGGDGGFSALITGTCATSLSLSTVHTRLRPRVTKFRGIFRLQRLHFGRARASLARPDLAVGRLGLAKASRYDRRPPRARALHVAAPNPTPELRLTKAFPEPPRRRPKIKISAQALAMNPSSQPYQLPLREAFRATPRPPAFRARRRRGGQPRARTQHEPRPRRLRPGRVRVCHAPFAVLGRARNLSDVRRRAPQGRRHNPMPEVSRGRDGRRQSEPRPHRRATAEPPVETSPFPTSLYMPAGHKPRSNLKPRDKN